MPRPQKKPGTIFQPDRSNGWKFRKSKILRATHTAARKPLLSLSFFQANNRWSTLVLSFRFMIAARVSSAIGIGTHLAPSPIPK